MMMKNMERDVSSRAMTGIFFFFFLNRKYVVSTMVEYMSMTCGHMTFYGYIFSSLYLL